jgi:hypothetical protein
MAATDQTEPSCFQQHTRKKIAEGRKKSPTDMSALLVQTQPILMKTVD